MQLNLTLIKHRYARWLIYSLLVIAFFPLLMRAINAALPDNGFDLEASLIPSEEIYHGGPPRDGIPAIDKPRFVAAAEATFLKGSDRVLGIDRNGVRKAYPIRILNYHEIVNDHFKDEAVVVTFCPLCGTGMAFEAKLDGKSRSFGVSGLLYNSDVLLYDRETESLWSQILKLSISGPMKGHKLRQLAISHTSWEEWQRGGDSLVLSFDTGFSRDYSRSPYGNYGESESIYFPVAKFDGRYHPKEIVIGVEIDGQFKAYPIKELALGREPLVDIFAGQELEVRFNVELRSGGVFDSAGVELPSLTAYWFAWYAFHPDGEVYSAQ
ncbi:DUF3179 domain-containing protein [Candidatus Reidiella endopervernicosa]|nr:DUF3179 domain-containing protein [Candidatus Reidiella endopervernicosa]